MAVGGRGTMENLQSKLANEMSQGKTKGIFKITALMRKYEEEDETYYVAECLEIPGCVADGETEDLAVKALNEAVNACISVIFEDCLKMAAERSSSDRDFVGITSQREMQFAVPELQYAYA